MAAAGFRIRRVKTENSIGDKLKRARTRRKITVAQAEEGTKIRAKFILALESDSWEQIPSEVYGRGYLESYVQFLKLPVDSIMKQYNLEREMYARHCQDARVELSPRQQVRLPRFLLTPRFFAIFLSAVALLGSGFIVATQIERFTSKPYLQVLSPVAHAQEEGVLTVEARSVVIAGKSTPGASLKINDMAVPVADDGSFSQSMSLSPGLNEFVVEANISGKVSQEIVSVRR